MTTPISDADYRALPGINWSTLSAMRQSPLAYRHVLTTPRPDTDAFALGRAVHHAILEPWIFADRYCVAEDADGQPIRRDPRTKAYQQFLAEHEGQTILTRQDYDEAQAMALAVRGHPLVAPYLVQGDAEVVLQWTDAAAGRSLKGRADWLGRDGAGTVLLDLKTTREIEARRFIQLAVRYGYHCQLAMYHDGLAVMGRPVSAVLIVAVEKAAPWDVAVYHLTDDLLHAGREEYRALLRLVLDCERSGIWPGRYTEPQTLTLPPWMLTDPEAADDLGLEME